MLGGSSDPPQCVNVSITEDGALEDEWMLSGGSTVSNEEDDS